MLANWPNEEKSKSLPCTWSNEQAAGVFPVMIQWLPHSQVMGDKDRDGFYCGEINGRTGLVPCNMVVEIEGGDQNTTDKLVHRGFLPLSTPVAKIGN